MSLLRHLICHLRLKKIIDAIVNQCLLCTLNAPKRIKKLIGSRRTNYYVPSQCLIIDSCYLPKSQTGYSKALICVDACTGYVIVYPSTNLQAATVRKHILTYLSSHLLPSKIKADFGSEFKKEFDRFLANYGISLSSCKPLSKGSTSQAELVIRLVKSALRQLCLSHTSNWPAMVPIMFQPAVPIWDRCHQNSVISKPI